MIQSVKFCFFMKYRKYQKSRFWWHLLSAPFIFAMIVPLVILDIGIEIYHRICFPLYGIAYGSRSKYISLDRMKLSYLDGMEKVFCAYCSYANGLLPYSAKIAGETEKYWCGIRHPEKKDFIEPPHHKDFLPNGDEAAFKEFLLKNEEK